MADSGAIDRARRLLRGASYGSLATVDRQDGTPIATLTAVATDRDASPLLLLSDLAEHTMNLVADPRVSLLIDGTVGLEERLTSPRLTVMGHMEHLTDETAAARYRYRHPGSAKYSDFGDFHLYRLVVDRAHQIAGFGRIDGIDSADLLVEPSLVADVAAIEPGAIQHMHVDHRDALLLLAGAVPGDDVVLAAIDADGIDLLCAGRPRRISFPQRLVGASGLRAAVSALAEGVRRPPAGNDAN